ncbi:MAG: DedA family protein [Gammaproteobacteria bacterium]|nr:DedA family protein [Gammaproteobacteria bacterium]
MKIFGPLYDRMMTWSRHRHAQKYLAFISFLESSFFPIPTSLMLAPMVMAQRDRAWYLASLTTVTSVLGGVFGYMVGYFLFEQVGEPIIEFYDAGDRFEEIKSWFGEYGVWLVVLAGLTPIPYKLCTIASGALGMALIPFVIASIIGRSSQFFLVALLVRFGGAKLEPVLHKWMEVIGWVCITLAVVAYLLVR